MKIVCFGDSNTYGYDARMVLDNRYPPEHRWVDILAKRTGWTFVNQGLNGREIPPYPIRFPEDADLLIIMLGTNDLLQGNSLQAVANRMDRFLNTLAISPDKILLISPVPMEMGAWVPDESIVKHSWELSEYYNHLSHVHGISFANAAEWGVELSYDGIHYTEEGQQRFADGLLKCLSTI